MNEKRYRHKLFGKTLATGGNENDQTAVRLLNYFGVNQDNILKLWEHAAEDEKEIIKNLSLEKIYDQKDDNHIYLIGEIVKNVRFEKYVTYCGRIYRELNMPCLVVKVYYIDEYKDEYFYITYIPVEQVKFSHKNPIYVYPSPDVNKDEAKHMSHSTQNAECIKLCQPKDKLVLYNGSVYDSAQFMFKNTVPTWSFLNIDSLFDIQIPPLYKLEVYINKNYENECAEESNIDNDDFVNRIRSTFKKRCEYVDIAIWNEELSDYEWFVDDQDESYAQDDDINDICDYFDTDQGVNTDDTISMTRQNDGSHVITSGKTSFDDYLESTKLPRAYIVTKQGVWLKRKDNNGDLKKVKISNAGIIVVALVRTEDQSEWRMLIVWLDRDGLLHEDLVPIEASLSRELISELLSKGCKLVHDRFQEMRTYLFKSEPAARYRLVKQTGWYTDANNNNQFALPRQIISNSSGEKIYFQTDNNSNSIRQMGSYVDWQDSVARMVSGNPLLIFTLSTAFASALLKIVGGETGGFHLHGQTSRGKTTAMLVAASVWGNAAPPSNSSGDSFINTWKTTANALEGIAAARNDILLILDELGQTEIDNVAKTIYDLSSGAGKERMNRDSSLADKKQWRLLYLSTGEISAKEAMEAFNVQAKAGQLVRLIDIDIEDDIIANPHDQSSADFVDALRENCAAHYGWAGPRFIEHLLDVLESPEEQQELADTYRKCQDRLANSGLEAEQYRVIKRFALVLLAGIYAARYDIIPLEEEEIIASVEAICSRWLSAAEPLSDTERAIKSIKDYLTANIAGFQDMGASSNTFRNLLGYQKDINGQSHYLFPKETFDKAVKRSNHRTLLRKLDQLGFLHKNNGERYQSRFSISERKGDSDSPKLSFYAISAEILNHGEPKPMLRRVLPTRPKQIAQ